MNIKKLQMKFSQKLNMGFRLFTILMTLGLTFVLFYLWVLAFLNGGVAPVNIILFGEANIELCLWIIMIPVLLKGAYLNLKEV